MSENTWSKGVSGTKSMSFECKNEHPFVFVKEHPLLIQEKIYITSRISEKNFPLLIKKKVTCPFHSLLLSNAHRLIFARLAKSCSFIQK